MVSAVLSFVGVLLSGFGLDWLACTRMAAFRTDYEYSYRPRPVRYALIALTAAVSSFVKATYDSSQPPIIGLLVIGFILIAWAIIAVRDVRREMVPRDLAPKRYADADY